MTSDTYSSESHSIAILLVDDHTSFRQSLAFILERENDLTVVGQSNSVASTRMLLSDSATATRFDVAIVDLGLPDGNGVDVVRMLHSRPIALKPKILVLTAESNRVRIADAIEAGADAVINKSATLATIFDAVRRLFSGEDLISPRETIELLRLSALTRQQTDADHKRLASLTQREREVLTALGRGLSDREIGTHLHISNQTVRTHMVNLLDKLQVNSRLQALVFALKLGAIDLADLDH